ncbi:chromosomal replication initiator protein DnaA [Flaviflexus huanghaiensis]|uniref:chromosomal replication initiator protein DnaA n=1 Tax=Flaviflexus huanghaiensis TaxID=1111473 RepID=UPI0015FC62D8|nr:chromosomal replication initiator protein DnaA [Flaviflexus huanghaiensis]
MSDPRVALDAWTAAIELLRAEDELTDSQTAFVRMAHPLATVDDIFVVAVSSDFIKSWIEENAAPAMEGKLTDILGREKRILISVDSSLGEAPLQQTAPEPIHSRGFSPETVSGGSTDYVETAFPAAMSFDPHEDALSVASAADAAADMPRRGPGASETALRTAGLNPRYTFDSFVIGESNRFAHGTSFAVAEAPGQTYNPLFIYGDSGMGKTHLMHAIGNYALNLYPELKVKYVSAEEFTNDFVNSLDKNTKHRFKERYRSIDILLIDDIQFFGDKEGTVEEFFHTFNALSNANKQIVISSDVAPHLLRDFEDRMISRFASGLTANIRPPDLETRMAIINRKAASEGLSVPPEVSEYIATKIVTNVRETEGALRRVTAYCDLSKQKLTVALAETVLKDIIADPDSLEITAGLIMAQTASYFRISIDDLGSPDRTRMMVTARQIAMYLCRELTDLSLPKIGDLFGGRDHTTVMHAYRKISNQMAQKEQVFSDVSALTAQIKQAATKNARG